MIFGFVVSGIAIKGGDSYLDSFSKTDLSTSMRCLEICYLNFRVSRATDYNSQSFLNLYQMPTV